MLTAAQVTSLLACLASAIIAAPPPAVAEDLMVSTAISLKEALFDISKRFEKQNAGVKIVLNAGASGELAAQIKNGAPVDVFVSADKKDIKTLADINMVANTPEKFAYNRLVVVTPKGSAPLKSIAEVVRFQKIGVGNPQTVPVGRYAEQALKSAGLLDKLNARHKFIYGQNARALVTYVEQENVNAAFIYLTDALASTKMSTAMIIPTSMTDPIEYQIARMSKSEHSKLAETFVKFALSDESKSDLLKHHFEKNWN